MDEAKRDLVRAWLAKARHDLLSARVLAAGPEPILDTAVYHCQQAGEKAAKGFLAFHDHPLERTHNVRRLIDLAQRYEPGFISWHEASELLAPYATAYRYPTNEPEPDMETFAEAEQAAAGLLEFVCSLLPEEVLPN